MLLQNFRSIRFMDVPVGKTFWYARESTSGEYTYIQLLKSNRPISHFLPNYRGEDHYDFGIWTSDMGKTIVIYIPPEQFVLIPNEDKAK